MNDLLEARDGVYWVASNGGGVWRFDHTSPPGDRFTAGAAGYRVFWREAWTPDWQHERNVGNVTELALRDVSIDDFIFGVAAYDALGHESLVSAYLNPPRPMIDVKTR